MTDRTPREVEDLIRAHLHLVPSAARRYFPGSREDQDLLQAGRIGLWQAACRWDGARPFPPYARVCIYNAMLDYLRREQSRAPTEPLREDLPAPSLERELGDLDLQDRIRAAWPAGSRERTILLALSGPTGKTELARDMGLSLRQVSRLAKKAWAKVS